MVLLGADVRRVPGAGAGAARPFLFPAAALAPDGERNAFHLQRLKPKLGNRSNASSEVEFHGAWARLVGEEGRGVATIIEMVQHTRLDCAIASAALMRRALAEAMHHARHRHAFGRALIDQPLMRNVLADLALESEAATVLAMRLARALDDDDRPFARLAIAWANTGSRSGRPPHVARGARMPGRQRLRRGMILPRLTGRRR